MKCFVPVWRRTLLEEIANSHWDDDSGEPQFDQHALYTERSSRWYSTSMASDWDDFSHQMKSNPEASVPLSEVFDEDAWRFAGTIPIDSVLYRARLGYKPGRGKEKVALARDECTSPRKGGTRKSKSRGRVRSVLC